MSGATGIYDFFVIGGGVNGCGVARDAAGRGYSVALAEKDDLASGTSSKSTKLIHGGLRYLETFEFRMVREALQERETCWRSRLISSSRCVSSCRSLPGARPAWMLRLGLFLYDHLGARKKLPGAAAIDLREAPEGADAAPELSQGLLLLGLPRGRRAAGGAQRPRRRRSRRRHFHPRRGFAREGRARASGVWHSPRAETPAPNGKSPRVWWSTPPGPGPKASCAARSGRKTRRACGWCAAAIS